MAKGWSEDFSGMASELIRGSVGIPSRQQRVEFGGG